jgi:hypothetical protein
MAALLQAPGISQISKFLDEIPCLGFERTKTVSNSRVVSMKFATASAESGEDYETLFSRHTPTGGPVLREP